jgi:hypothetical protein
LSELEVDTKDPIASISPFGGTTSYATVVSMLPLELRESKPGLIPAQFIVPKAKPDDFEILVVRDAFHYIYLDSDRGSIPSIDPAYKVATSIVYDYANNILLRDDDSGPGLFCVPGKYNKDEIKKNFALELKTYRQKQINWYRKLIAFADDEWAINHRRRGISDLSRFAAQSLGMEREWVEVGKIEDIAPAIIMSPCPACYSPVNPEAAICAVCKTIINKEKWDKLQKAS